MIFDGGQLWVVTCRMAVMRLANHRRDTFGNVVDTVGCGGCGRMRLCFPSPRPKWEPTTSFPSPPVHLLLRTLSSRLLTRLVMCCWYHGHRTLMGLRACTVDAVAPAAAAGY